MKLRTIAMRVGFNHLLAKNRHCRRLASWLYHWGSGRIDLHRSDYAAQPADSHVCPPPPAQEETKP